MRFQFSTIHCYVRGYSRFQGDLIGEVLMKRITITDEQIGSLLAGLAGEENFVLLDTSMVDEMNSSSLLFTRPIARLRYASGDERAEFLDQTARWLDKGCYLAGWLGYEFLHDQHGITEQGNGELLADLGVYHEPFSFDHQSGTTDFPFQFEKTPHDSTYNIGRLQPSMDEENYCRAIEQILDYIAAGDTYQVNYTFKLHFEFDGSAAALYRDLRRSQPVSYGSFIKQGNRHILSFSPELFFRLDSGEIIARPMKGTMKRGRTAAEDRQIEELLSQDVKNRSENVMIVDLLRNDLSRLVEATGGGTVRVDSLFDVERYRTVFQMTSTITAARFDTAPVRPAQILDAIFPCGSVTGAPKIRTMEIIAELETQPRGVYTGAIGYFAPSGDGVFNVPIRTVVIEGRRGEMGIGSGIVADSTARDEWRECLLKARFLTDPPPRFDLIETMFYDPESGYLFEEQHIERLRRSADYLGFACDKQNIGLSLDQFAARNSEGCSRVRLKLSVAGGVTITSAPTTRPGALTLGEALQRSDGGEIGLAEERTNSLSAWLFHKTTMRRLYDTAYQQALSDGLIDIIFCNERDEVTEGAISNVIIQKGGNFYTPPLSCGVLPGVMREVLMADADSERVEERLLYLADLQQADRIFICNSVRGVIPVSLKAAPAI